MRRVVLYVVGERRVYPGQADAYLASAEMIASYWATTSRQESFYMCLAEDDPDRVLAIGAWPDRESFERVYSTIPPDLRQAASSPVMSGTGDWRWYGLAGELRRFADQPTVVSASRFRIEPEQSEALLDWARGVRSRALSIPGVVVLRLLQSLNEPGQFLHVGVFGAEAARASVRALIESPTPSVRLFDQEEFLGRIGYGWIQASGRPRIRGG